VQRNSITSVTNFSGTGGGLRDPNFQAALHNATKPALIDGTKLLFVPPPPSWQVCHFIKDPPAANVSIRRSSVLDGAKKYINTINRVCPFTILIESTIDDAGHKEYVVLRRRGECLDDPVVPAARCIGNTIFDIEDAEQASS
jgi:hypothetical protein